MQIHSTKQAAELLNTTPRQVTRWCDTGRLKSYRLPGTWERRIPHEFLEKFATENGIVLRQIGTPSEPGLVAQSTAESPS